jgi:hypothetical protein
LFLPNGVVIAAWSLLILFVVLFFELFLKLHFPLPMKNSNTEEIYHLDGDGSVVSLFFLHRQFFDITVDVITIKRLFY